MIVPSLAWTLAKSPLLTSLFCAPGNPGIAQVATCVALDPADHAAVVAFCREKDVSFVVVGPEGKIVHYKVGHYPVDREAGLKQLDAVVTGLLAAEEKASEKEDAKP